MPNNSKKKQGKAKASEADVPEEEKQVDSSQSTMARLLSAISPMKAQSGQKADSKLVSKEDGLDTESDGEDDEYPAFEQHQRLGQSSDPHEVISEELQHQVRKSRLEPRESERKRMIDNASRAWNDKGALQYMTMKLLVKPAPREIRHEIFHLAAMYDAFMENPEEA